MTASYAVLVHQARTAILYRLFASGFLQILPRDRHPCLWLIVPLAGPIEDFHLQVTRIATTANQAMS